MAFGPCHSDPPKAEKNLNPRAGSNLKAESMTETPEEQPENERPLTREDVLRCIKEKGGKAWYMDLSGKIFQSHADLTGLNLSLCNLRGADLSFCNIQGANLEGAELQKANLIGADLRGANLINARLQEADLMNAKLQGAWLADAKLEGANLTGAVVSGAYLHSVAGDISTHPPVDMSPNQIASIDWGGNYSVGEEEEQVLEKAVRVYHTLRTRYTQLGMGDTAGEFFYREMECRRKALPWWPLWHGGPWRKLGLGILGGLCGYGERWLNVIVSGLTVLLGLTLVYSLFGGLPFWNALYFSAVSFTALGYGFSLREVGIPDWAHGLGAAEALIGTFMTALFLTTFVRKMTR